jgi:Mg-chelatase subunit ChlD
MFAMFNGHAGTRHCRGSVHGEPQQLEWVIVMDNSGSMARDF